VSEIAFPPQRVADSRFEGFEGISDDGMASAPRTIYHATNIEGATGSSSDTIWTQETNGGGDIPSVAHLHGRIMTVNLLLSVGVLLSLRVILGIGCAVFWHTTGKSPLRTWKKKEDNRALTNPS
jgi:hypothetical protein